jgi:hypothetical protein
VSLKESRQAMKGLKRINMREADKDDEEEMLEEGRKADYHI